MTTGVLLTNIGTPDSPTASAIRPYLKAFLSDPRIVEIPRLIWWPILHGFILRSRPQKSAILYQKIWTPEGSPLWVISKKIGEKLRRELNLPVELGMNYGEPSIKTALERLRDCERIIVLPLFPQYSATTTAVSFDQVSNFLKTQREIPALFFNKHYSDHPAYIRAIINSIQDFWKTHGRAQHLLFSFHGIPETFVKAGDPYADQCRLTVKKITETLSLEPNQFSTAFQSRLGRAKWLSPYTEHVLKQLPKQGVSHLQVVCPGFSVDCLETLEEIAIRGKEQFLQAGGKKFEYIPALNDSDDHIELLKHVYLSLQTTG